MLCCSFCYTIFFPPSSSFSFSLYLSASDFSTGSLAFPTQALSPLRFFFLICFEGRVAVEQTPPVRMQQGKNEATETGKASYSLAIRATERNKWGKSSRISVYKNIDLTLAGSADCLLNLWKNAIKPLNLCGNDSQEMSLFLKCFHNEFVQDTCHMYAELNCCVWAFQAVGV